MVKTRHSQDADVEASSNFLSLESRSTNRTRLSVLKSEDDSDDSGVVNFRNKSLTQEPNHQAQTRSSRSTAKRVTYVEDYLVEDSDSEVEVRRPTRGRVGRAKIHDEDVKENGNSDDNDAASEEESPHDRRQVGMSRRGRVRRTSGPVSPAEREQRSHDRCHRTRQKRQTADFLVSHPSSRQLKREQLDELEEDGIRRSSRKKNSTYHTYDQKVLEHGYDIDEQPRRKRARREVHASDTSPVTEDAADGEGFTDIYSRVKRQRKTIKRDMYGMPIETDNEDVDEEGDDDDNDEDGEDGNDEDNEEEENDEDDDDDTESKKSDSKTRRSYNLRENKPRTQLYIAPVHEKRPRNQSRFFNDEISTPHSPARRRRRPEKLPYLSPARRRGNSIRHRRRAFHGSSSTSSSDSSSSDEEKFQRRKAKSMMKARQSLLPMNFDPDDIARSTVLRDRQKIGSSLADVDPMTIDKSVTFDSVGGLGKHIRALKEMVVFPLMYPEVFERFKISPPRGVLFYGPPGTGKTLVARALANECSQDDRRVAFYMRKGADCLSKWVGESERQLRLLFDQAYQTRPSIIFFDEIDGLAPVRSSRQDQIHSSIVSTLLALMDGLDSRGEIVVIGATNRLDSIDPALRRPGRFDREFLFPLPSVQARSQILKIHTKEWNPKLCDKFVTEVAERCIGYCGADMKALCTEAALLALRRRYPQIYTSSEKLQIDVTSINMNARDFHNATKSIVPASQRSVTCAARALGKQVAPLLTAMFSGILVTLDNVFPTVLMQLSNLDAPADEKTAIEGVCGDAEVESDDDGVMNIYEQKIDKRRKHSNIPETPESFLNFTSYANRQASTHRPRLLISGYCDQGQTSHIAPALIHHLEQLPVNVLDLSSLYAVSARTPEESCAHIFREARRTSPSIVYLPHVNQWWNIVGDTVRSTILTLIQDLDPSSPVLLLATSEESYGDLEISLQDLFDEFSSEVVAMKNPTSDERREFFKDLLFNQATRGPPLKKITGERILEVLPKAPPPEPRKLTEQEVLKLEEHEEATLTELRLFLRDVLNKLGRDRKFFIFTKPVDIEDVPDYYDIIKKPMDLSTMMSKIDLHHYQSVKEFLADINQISLNALEYNPDRDPQSRVIRHRACALKDTARAIIKTELDPEFEKVCESIVGSRKKRGVEGAKSAPSFYYTRPLNTGPMHPLAVTKQNNSTSNLHTPRDPNVRTSRRLQGAIAADILPLEEVEKNARVIRSLQRISNSPEKQDTKNCTPQGQVKKNTPASTSSSGLHRSQGTSDGSKTKLSAQKSSQSSSASKKPARKNIWGPSGYKTRKRKRKRVDTDAEEFVELPLENDNEDENEEDSGNDEETEEQMDEQNDTDEVMPDNKTRSPSRNDLRNRSPRHSSGDKASQEKDKMGGNKSPGKVSVTESLSVDVNMKSPKECMTKSPSQRSPRGASQRSPRQQIDESLARARSDSCPAATRHRHSVESKSPRASDSSHNEPGQKSPRSVHKSDKTLTNIVSPVLNVSENAIDGSPSKSASQAQDKNVIKTQVNGFVDSGVGSSDSNGDSNDSHGKLLAEKGENVEQTAGTSQVPVTTVTGSEPMEDDCLEKDSVPKDPPSPVFHLTRARVHTNAQEKAVQAINELREPVVVDRERLVRLLDLTVLLTEDYVIPRLEKLYNLYAQSVYQHRQDSNKTQLLEDMERKLKMYTSSITNRMKAEKSRALTNQI